jgi:hypothetical protein
MDSSSLGKGDSREPALDCRWQRFAFLLLLAKRIACFAQVVDCSRTKALDKKVTCFRSPLIFLPIL